MYGKIGQEHTFPPRPFGLSRPSSVSVCAHTLLVVYTHYIYSLYKYINWLFAGYSSSLGHAVEWGNNRSTRSLLVIEQVSQGIHPEVHSRRMWVPQGPDPPAFLYLAETWVMAVYFIYRHDGHVSKSVSFAIKVFRHMRFLPFPLGLLQYRSVLIHYWWYTHIIFIVYTYIN